MGIDCKHQSLTRWNQIALINVILLELCLCASCDTTDRSQPPVNPRQLAQAANNALRQHDYARAVELYTRFIDAAELREVKTVYAAYGQRSIAQFELGMYEEALHDAGKGIELAESDSSDTKSLALLYFMRGKSHRALGKSALSESDFQKARVFDPTLPEQGIPKDGERETGTGSAGMKPAWDREGKAEETGTGPITSDRK